MKTQDRYSEMLGDFFQQFRIEELNEKIKKLNDLFEKDINTNIILIPSSIPAVDAAHLKHSQKNNRPQNREHGAIKELIRKTVKNMGVSRVTKISIQEALKNEGHDVKLGTIAGTLKKWAKEKDPSGIRRSRKGKGATSTTYINLGVEEK